jgi:hypothetical protein
MVDFRVFLLCSASGRELKTLALATIPSTWQAKSFIQKSSSSFIEPPATGHHRWSGAKKAFFYTKNYFTITENKSR